MEKVLAVLAQTAEGVFALDQTHRIVFWNAAAERLLGYRAAEVMGRPCHEVFAGAPRPGCLACQADCPVLADQLGPAPYMALQGISEHFNPRGYRNYLKTNYLKELSDDAIDILVERYASVPALFTHVVVEHMGGAVSRMDPNATAYNYRDAQYNFLIVGMWTEAADDARNIPWVRTFWQALQPFSTGNIYVNYESDIGVDRVSAAYGAAKYNRLVALKNTYDPANFFRLNANIKPTV